MDLPDIDTALGWVGRTVVDRDGEKIGTFDEIYLDAETDRPEWAAVKTGLLGRRRALVPLSEAAAQDDDLRVPFEKSHVEGAPTVEAESELSQDEEAALYEHYGVGHSRGGSASVLPDEDAERPAAGGEPDAMVVSEEELRVGRKARPRERVRIKRYVVTEHVKKTVPLRREEVRLEHEPPDAGERPGGAPEPA